LGKASGSQINNKVLIPKDWTLKPARGEGGFRYVDPTNEANHIRLMPGQPNSIYKNSREPYMRIHTVNGYTDANGNPVSRQAAAGHITIKSINVDK